MFKRIILATLLASLAAVGFAANTDFVIPASGSVAGALGSRWQTEVTMHNIGDQPIDLTLTFHNGTGTVKSFDMAVNARATVSVGDIVATKFGLTDATGAIAIDVKNDALVERLAITSRTFNKPLTGGEFGQDIPAVNPSDALVKGDSGILTAPSDAANVRFNFGIYALENSTIDWSLVRADGTVVKTVTKTYDAGVQAQYTNGAVSFFESTASNNDVIQANVQAGRIVIYGSAVNNASGDPTFVPQSRTREAAPIEILGLDMDENGTVDIQAHDGIVVERIALQTSLFPNYFRVVASGAPGKTLTYQLIDPSRDVTLIDANGTIQWSPGADVRGTTGSLTVRVSDGFHTTDLIIPVKFL